MRIIATKPVSINWQIFFVFTIDPIAFYRIKKATRYLLITLLPAAIISTTISSIFTDFDCEPHLWLLIIYDTCIPLEPQIVIGIVYGAFLVFSIYLIRKWSMEWNKQFD